MKRKYPRHEDKKKELLKDPEIRKAYKAELSILKRKPFKEAHYSLADYKKEIFKDSKVRDRCEKAFAKLKLEHQILSLRGRRTKLKPTGALVNFPRCCRRPDKERSRHNLFSILNKLCL